MIDCEIFGLDDISSEDEVLDYLVYYMYLNKNDKLETNWYLLY